MAVTKRTRYEVLRRDGNKCRYCGASAEESPLTVDHVTPVSLGGSDDPSNLVAACRDCNSGKSSSSPDGATVAQVADDAVRWAAAMKQAASDLEAKIGSRAKLIRAFDDAWRAEEAISGKFPRADDWPQGLSSMLAAGLTIDMAIDLIPVAVNSKVTNYNVWRYFCGCAWKTVKDIRESAVRIVSVPDGRERADSPGSCGHCDPCRDPEVSDGCYMLWPAGEFGGKECPHCGVTADRCLWLAGYFEGNASGFSEACDKIEAMEAESGKTYATMLSEVPY